jgi:hypothetical protein
MASCVAAYLPKGAFVVKPKLDWVCAESDPRIGSERLRTATFKAVPGRRSPTR